MIPFPDFEISPTGPISQKFLERNITTFARATEFIRLLPYGRNKNKSDLGTLFHDLCGTCSSKHALLKVLAEENNSSGIDLIIGLFKMHAKNTPAVEGTLKQNGLPYIPEAHCYLRANCQVLDFTTATADPSDFLNELLEEIVILPHQISDFKVSWHKKKLDAWLSSNTHIRLSAAELWLIREQCIKDLENQKKQTHQHGNVT